MHKDRITELALANGFKLKEQPDGIEALNPYVFDFARAIIAADRVQRQAVQEPVAWKTQSGSLVTAPFENAAKYGWTPLFTAPPPAQVPEGFVLVPLEPTEEMRNAAAALPYGFNMATVYRAMLAAAPDWSA